MSWDMYSNMQEAGQTAFLTMQDGTKIRTMAWPSKEGCRGIIVLVNGHREYMEKYYEFIDDFLKRGFALYTLDNRGQGLSDRELPDRTKSYASDFDLFSNDLNEVMSNLVLNDPRSADVLIYLLGHSLGGHICLRYLHDFPGIVSKALVMAPMIEFNLGGIVTKTFLKGIIRAASYFGLSRKFAMGQGNLFSKKARLIRQKLLTHDDDRYAVEADIIKSNPELYVGGATFGWLDTAFDSINKIKSPGYIKEISTPVLAVLAGADFVVNSDASGELLSGYDNIDIAIIEGSRHEIYRESDIYRDQLWQKIDEFLGVKQG